VASVEPDRFSQLSHGLQAEKGVSLHAPAAFFAEHAREYVGNRIQIGRNVQSPPLEIVPGINDDGEFLGGNHLPKTVYEFGASSSAGKHNNHAAVALQAWPSRSAAALTFSARSPGPAVTAGKNSG